MKTFAFIISAATLALVACGPTPTPASDPVAATKALEQSGYTNVADVRQVNGFDMENCTQEEALYCNTFVATDRRGVRVAGVVVEEIDGELEIDHFD